MRELVKFDEPTRVICHFRQDELKEGLPGGRIVYYQVLVDCQQSNISPCGEFIKMTHDKECQLHGWMRIEDLVIDTVLEVAGFEEEKEEWIETDFIGAKEAA